MPPIREIWLPLVLLAGLIIVDPGAFDPTAPKTAVLALGLALGLAWETGGRRRTGGRRATRGRRGMDDPRGTRARRGSSRKRGVPGDPTSTPGGDTPPIRADDLDLRVTAWFAVALGLTLARTAPDRLADGLVWIALAAGAFFAGRHGATSVPTFLATQALAVLLIVPLGVLAWWTGFWMKPDSQGLPRWQAFELVSTLGNPNHLASWLVLILPGLAAWRSPPRADPSLPASPAPDRRAPRRLASVALFVGVLGLLATLSRGAWIAVLGTALLGGFTLRARTRTDAGTAPPTGRRLPGGPLRGGLPAVLGLAVVLLGIGILVTPAVRQKLGSWQTGIQRVELYRAAARLILEAPLVGHGLGSFGARYPGVRTTARPERQVVMISDHVHNIVLEILVGGGLVLLAFTLGVLGTPRSAAPGPDAPENPPDPGEDPALSRERVLRSGLMLGGVGFFLHNLVSITAFVPITMTLAFFTAGLTVRRPRAGPAPLRWRAPVIVMLVTLGIHGIETWSAHRHAARVLLAGGDPDVVLGPRGPRYQHAGRIHARGAYGPAMARYLALESLEPGYGRLHFNRGRLDLDRGRLEPARLQLERAAAGAPGTLRVAWALAEVHYRLGRFETSAHWLARAEALDPPADLARQIQSLADHVRIRIAAGDPPPMGPG